MAGPSRRQPLASGRTQKANKNATLQLKGRQSVKTPSGRLLSACCQVAVGLGEAPALDGRQGQYEPRGADPAVIATRLFCQPRQCAGVGACVVRQPGYPLTERAINFIVKEAAARAGINPAASIHRLRHAHASHAIDNGG
jgi:hypothetical protein